MIAPIGQTSLTPSTPTALEAQTSIRVYGERRQLFKNLETALVPHPSTSQAVDEIPNLPVGPSNGNNSLLYRNIFCFFNFSHFGLFFSINHLHFGSEDNT